MTSHVVIVGGGATGLSSAFWLRREGVAVTVIEKGIVGWEASGRNGGGATHPYSPLFREEQRLWPMMDDLLGYPTEHRPQRVRIAINQSQLDIMRSTENLAVQQGFTKGRRVSQVAAACLYVVCRQEGKPFMLIDYSDYLQVID